MLQTHATFILRLRPVFILLDATNASDGIVDICASIPESLQRIERVDRDECLDHVSRHV
jgi:hypothetical protein